MPQESDNPSIRVSQRSYLALDALKEAGMTTFDGVIKALLFDFSQELFGDLALDQPPSAYRKHATRAWSAFMKRQVDAMEKNPDLTDLSQVMKRLRSINVKEASK